MEPPTRELAQRLSALGLANAADLRRCAARVRKLARGLPATDSVWIDALILAGKLTLHQARGLETDRVEELVIGRKFVLRHPLHLDRLLSTYEAISPGQRETFLISRMPCPPQTGDAAALRILKTIKSMTAARDQIFAAPFDALLERENLFLLAPFQSGEPLSRLLVRRGRFPEPVVRAIAQELVRQLQAMEGFAVHGDLRLANVWLTSRGDVGLLNWGLLDAVCPEINIHSQLPLDTYDGMAPERIDSGKRATIVSDVYALGCLLWQLLTGRPPYPVADPLAKLTAHRLRQVPDVRTLAPDVSEGFSQLIRNLTARDGHRRPQSYPEIRQLLAPTSNWNRGRLQKFVQQFESATPRQLSEVKTRSRIPALAGAVLLTAGLGIAVWNRDRLALPGIARVSAAAAESAPVWTKSEPTEPHAPLDLPSVSTGIPDQIVLGDANPPAVNPMTSEIAISRQHTLPATAETSLLPLPAPTVAGVIALAANQQYLASEIIAGETLILRSERDRPATIHVQTGSLILEADNIQLENVHLVVDADAAILGTRAPVQVRTQTLSITHSTLKWDNSSVRNFLLHWSAPTGSTSAGARLLIHETVVSTSANVVHLEIPLVAGLLDHVLGIGNGTLLDLRKGVGAGLRVPVMINACTLRRCGPVVTLPTGDVLNQSGRFSLQGTDSVIELARGCPLFAFAGGMHSSRWQEHVEVAAQGLIMEVGAMLAGTRFGSQATFEELISNGIQVDGLLSGDFHFDDENSTGANAHRVQIDALPVRFSSRLPGVDFTRLPRW